MAMLARAGLAEIAMLTARRRVERRDQVEAWGPLCET
jgi:hypothetical protein